MSCGVCPGDMWDHGIGLRMRESFYSGKHRETYTCAPPRLRQYAASSQTNAASQYAQGATNMQPRSQYQSQVNQRMPTNYVSNQYAKPIALPVYTLIPNATPSLETRVNPMSGLETKLELPMYEPQRILRLVETEVQDRAREVVSLQVRRQLLEDEIRERLKEAA